MALEVLDAHLHLWDRSRLSYPWLEGEPGLPWSFLPEDLATPPQRAIVVQADCVPEQGLAEARWVDELGHAWPAIVGFVAFAPLERGSAVGPFLDELSAIPAVKGIRRLFQDESDEWLGRPALVDGLREVAARGLTFDACIRARQLPALLGLRRSAPEATIVLDHLGKPPIAAGWGSPEAERWHRALTELAGEDATFVKLSGVAPETGRPPVAEAARPFVAAAIEAFGPARCLAGSDWPVSSLQDPALDYAGWFEELGSAYGLSSAERDLVLRVTAERAYRLPG